MKKGFTLIELILYIGILTIILASLIPFAWNIIISSEKSNVIQEVSSNARLAGELIKQEIRSSIDINSASSNFGVNLASNPSYKLSLVKNSPDNPTIIRVNGGKIYIKKGLSDEVAITSKDVLVTDLVFTNYSSVDSKTKNIGFNISLKSNYSSQNQQYQSNINLVGDSEIRSN